MQIKIDNSCGRPVYQQIIDAIKRDIALGRIRPGERLPAVRELAGELVINPNTIAKAYKQLERENIIVTRAGAGAFVGELGTDLNEDVCKKLICDQIEKLLTDAVHMRISEKQMRKWLDDNIKKFNFPQS